MCRYQCASATIFIFFIRSPIVPFYSFTVQLLTAKAHQDVLDITEIQRGIFGVAELMSKRHYAVFQNLMVQKCLLLHPRLCIFGPRAGGRHEEGVRGRASFHTSVQT